VVQPYFSLPIKEEAVSLYVACTQSENDGWQGRLKGLGVSFPPSPTVLGSCHSWPSTSGGLEAGPSPQHVFRVSTHCMSSCSQNDGLGLQKVSFAAYPHLSSSTSYRPLVYVITHAHSSLPFFLSFCTARSSHQDSSEASLGWFFPSSHESTVEIEREREKAEREYTAWPATAADLEAGERRLTFITSTSGQHLPVSTQRAPLDFCPQATVAPGAHASSRQLSPASTASQRLLRSAGFQARSSFDARIGHSPVSYANQADVSYSLDHISALNIAVQVMQVGSESLGAAGHSQRSGTSAGTQGAPRDYAELLKQTLPLMMSMCPRSHLLAHWEGVFCLMEGP
jgi:hypothetical protein